MTVIKICSDCLLKNVYSHLIDDFENDAGECAICRESVEKRLTIAPNTKLGKYIHAVSEFYCTFLDHITQQPSSLSAISSQIFSASVVGKQIPKKIYDILRSNIGGTVSVFSDFQNGASPYSHSPPTAMSKVYYGFPRLRSEILDEYKKISKHIEDYPNPQEVFRARIGACTDRNNLYDPPIPFEKDEIGAPPSDLSANGRLNRSGASCLYCANDVETAIHEVKPEIGDYVSIAKFKTKDNIKIANFFNVDLWKFYDEEFDTKTIRLFARLMAILSYPKGSKNNSAYVASQLLAENVMDDYDGMCYKSFYTGGINYVFFDPQVASYVANSSRCHMISRILIEHSGFEPLQ